jgi:hypothetical protein
MEAPTEPDPKKRKEQMDEILDLVHEENQESGVCGNVSPARTPGRCTKPGTWTAGWVPAGAAGSAHPADTGRAPVWIELGGEDSNPQWQGQNLQCCRLHHPRTGVPP